MVKEEAKWRVARIVFEVVLFFVLAAASGFVLLWGLFRMGTYTSPESIIFAVAIYSAMALFYNKTGLHNPRKSVMLAALLFVALLVFILLLSLNLLF